MILAKPMRNKVEGVVADIATALDREKEIRHFNRDHIFFTAIALIKSKVSALERVRIVYVFSEIEKTLSLMRSAKAHAFVPKFEQTYTLYKGLDEKLQFYLGESFYPMRSFYWYIQGKYDMAVVDLHRFFTISKTVFKDHLEAKALAICEQHLNLFRIYFSAKQYDKARETAKDLLLLAMYGIENQFIEESLAHEAVAENQSWQAYLINSLFRRYLYDPNHETKLIRLIQSLSESIPENKSDAFSLAIKALNAFYDKNAEGVLHYVSLVFRDKRNELPDILLYILLSKFATVIKDSAPEFGAAYADSMNTYCGKHILKTYNASYIHLLDWNQIDADTKPYQTAQPSTIQSTAGQRA